MKKKLILTRRWPQSVEQALAQQYDCEFNLTDKPFTTAQIHDALRNADALLTTVTDKLDSNALNIDNPRTRIIANYGVGYSHIDTSAAKQRGITITNTPDVLSDCTADLAMTLMLMVARRAGEGERELRNNQWTGWRPTHMIGTKVSGKTLGIIGFGRIGRAMANRAHYGFGMNIKVFNRSAIAPEVLATVQAEQIQTINELASCSDFISLHCPGGAENTHLINKDIFDAMKSDAYLINTARGEVVDENALIKALTEKSIAGAGLDVFDNEPDINPRFSELDNAVLLPHLGSATRETRDGMGFRVAANLESFFSGKAPADIIV